MAHLITLGQIRVEIIFPVEDGAFSNAGTDAQTKLARDADGFPIVEDGSGTFQVSLTKPAEETAAATVVESRARGLMARNERARRIAERINAATKMQSAARAKEARDVMGFNLAGMRALRGYIRDNDASSNGVTGTDTFA